MLVNLHTIYGTGFSVSKDDMTFYNKVNDDFLFKKGDKIEIYVAPTRKTMKLNYKLCHNLITTPFKTGYAENLQAYVFKIAIDTKDLRPGFYDLYCEAEFGTGATALNSCSSKAYCTFGYDIENMGNYTVRPDDFDEFWEKTKKKLDGVDLQLELGEEYTYNSRQINDYNVAEADFPCSYDEEGIVYDEVVARKISFMSASGMRIYGWFARPKKEGKYPGMMIYPGAGYHSRSMPLEHARHGYAALDIQVHGQDCDAPKEAYVPTPPLTEHGDYMKPYEFYYNDIYMHALQALNALCALDGVDSERIVCVGGSQGGRLSTVAAAMDKRVKGIVISIPHFNGQPYLYWADKMNKENNDGATVDYSVLDGELMKNIGYYDTTNFAPYIKCPVFCGSGLVDKVSPISCVMTLFDAIGSENKTYIPFPMMAHDWNAEFDRAAWRWLKTIV